MKRVVGAGGPLADHVRRLYLETRPQAGTTMWSMMWDELTVASIIDSSVVTKSETMYLDVDISHGPKYGHTVIWKPPADVPAFFLAYSGPDAVDREKWKGHLAPPGHLHPATVQMEVDATKFENIFVDLMSH